MQPAVEPRAAALAAGEEAGRLREHGDGGRGCGYRGGGRGGGGKGKGKGKGLGTLGTATADLYNKYPTAFLTQAQAATRLEETEEEKRRRLRERYGITVPELPPEMSAYLKD